jgi:hypothetical protein
MEEIEEYSETHYKIQKQISDLLVNLGGGMNEIAILMSWGDTQTESQILQMLIDTNDIYKQSKSI